MSSGRNRVRELKARLRELEARPANHGQPYFTIRLDPHHVSAETAYRIARVCKEILEERAPAGMAIGDLEFHESQSSRSARTFSERVRAAMSEIGELERYERVKTSLKLAASRVGEEIDPL